MIVRHMSAVHAHDPGFNITCGIQGCTRTYTNFYSFKKHLYWKHRDSLTMSTVEREDISITDFEDYAGGSNEELCIQPASSKTHTDHEQQIALFLLKSKEIRKVSQVSLDGLIDDFTSLLSFKVHTLESNVQSCLLANGINMDNHFSVIHTS